MIFFKSFSCLLFVFALIFTQSMQTCGIDLSQILYDDSYITDNLDERFPYLKLPNGSYTAPRDYFNFSHVFKPSNSYLEGINIEEHLFEELRAMEFSSSIATMDQWHYSDGTELLQSRKIEADEQRCAQELAYIDRKLNLSRNNSERLLSRGLDNIRLLRYIDAWGRPPSETYYGHSYWVGSYRACKLANLPGLGDSPTIKFRYCWGKLKAKSWPDLDEMVPPTSFRVGLCLPNTCDTTMANRHNQTIHRIMSFNFSPFHRDRFNQFIDIFCLPNQDGLPLRAKVFLAIIGSWLTFLVGLSLLASSPAKRSLSGSPLQSITIQASYRRFVSDDSPRAPKPSDDIRTDLRSLGVIRLLGSVAVCVAHAGCSFGWVFNSSAFSLIEYRKLTYHIMPSLLKSLDLFMVIGGLLTAFTIAKKFPGHRIDSILKPKIYLGLLIVRYLRLTPMLMLVLYFMKALYPSLSDGPNWDYGTYKFSMQGQCQRSSWLRILVFPILFGFKGNFYLSECLPVSWYLVTDLKLAFVAPLLIYLFHKLRPNLSWLTIIITVLISTFWQYHGYTAQRIIYFRQFFTYGQLFGVNILNLTFGETGYYNPINRLYAFAIGVFAGIHLHNYHQQTSQQTRWPFWMTGYSFWALIVWQFYDFFSPHIAQYNYLNNGYIPPEETIKLVMLIKPRIDAIIFAIVALRLTTDLAPKLMRNAMPLYKLSKLSYCVFLIHAIIISYVVSSNERSRPDSEFSQFIVLTTFVIAMSFIISFPLYLLFESPFAQILSNFMFKRGQQIADKLDGRHAIKEAETNIADNSITEQN